MSKKSAKKRQPVVKPAVQEAMSATVPLGYEEMLTELEAIVADAEARLAEEEAAARNHAGWRRKRPLRLITGRPDKRSAIGQHAAPTSCRGVIINALYWP